MGNMSYCKFENTYNNLENCFNDMEALSKSEIRYRNKLIELCGNIWKEYGEGAYNE